MSIRGWARALLLVAALKVLGGIAAAWWGPSLLAPGPAAAFPLAVHLLQILVFGSAAAWLIYGGRGDRRALYLSGVFLTTASAFCGRMLNGALEGGAPEVAAGLFSLLRSLQAEALLPLFLWLFARDFPRTSPYGPAARAAQLLVRVSGGAGLLLFAANLALLWVPGGRLEALRLLERSDQGLFWIVVFALTLPALPFIAWKARAARLEERRRARLFVAGLVLGMGPLFLEVVLEILFPPFARFMRRPAVQTTAGGVFYALLLSIPVTTAYSVLVHRVLEVRLIVRRALRYALARNVVIAAAAVPLAGLTYFVWSRREQPVAELLGGGGGLFLALASLAALAALRLRQPLLEAVDKRFFREQYDARQILADLVRKSRGAEGPEKLAGMLEGDIDRALHLESIAVLSLDRAAGRFVSPEGRVRPLAAGSALATLATGGTEPLATDLESPGSPLARLPEGDRQWLADGGFRLLVPLIASTGSALGLIALGEKKSELPYSREDVSLLGDIAASGSLALENLILLTSSGSLEEGAVGLAAAASPAEDRPAYECPGCGILQAPGAEACATCGGALREAPVPAVLLGKFQFERRLGAGGMGVVYRARDLVLDRHVAIKTLPRMSPERAVRMRREARAMAAVSHSNLALIFGAESWKGTPMLIFEFLSGGSLADRLVRGRLSTAEAIDLGLALADGLDRLHRAGVLHRDIKPSNIGFDGEGVPKLLDFGLARILRDGRDEEEAAPLGARDELGGGVSTDATLTLTAHTKAGRLVGTPLYMSPEAARGEPPDPSFDLWSLAVVLYESIAGRLPFRGPDLKQTLRLIRKSAAPDLREARPDCPAPMAELFRQALDRRPSRRPGSARELRRRLESLRTGLSSLAA